MSELVKIKSLYKKYGKSKTVFEDLNLTIESGKIIALLGPNGSGKTTLIKLIAGLLTPNSGKLLVNDMHVGAETKAIVSYLPERSYFNESFTIDMIIEIFKDFYADFEPERAYEMLKLLKIEPKSVIKTLSKGNKEKVQLIMVMSRRAKLYLLDEPIAGVDPAARDYILNTIITNYDEGATILLSTHLITDIENIIDHVIMIKDGKIIYNQGADELRQAHGKSIDELFREEFRCWEN